MNRRFPASVPVKELLNDITDKSARQTALDALLMGFVQGPFQLSADTVPFCTEITNKPRCTPLARYQAKNGTRITNLRHEDFIAMPQQRFLIERMDGTRTVEDLANELRSALLSGRFQVSKDGKPVRPSSEEMLKIVQQELVLFRVLPMLVG
jgi:methyltransferase-like protein